MKLLYLRLRFSLGFVSLRSCGVSAVFKTNLTSWLLL